MNDCRAIAAQRSSGCRRHGIYLPGFGCHGCRIPALRRLFGSKTANLSACASRRRPPARPISREQISRQASPRRGPNRSEGELMSASSRRCSCGASPLPLLRRSVCDHACGACFGRPCVAFFDQSCRRRLSSRHAGHAGSCAHLGVMFLGNRTGMTRDEGKARKGNKRHGAKKSDLHPMPLQTESGIDSGRRRGSISARFSHPCCKLRAIASIIAQTV